MTHKVATSAAEYAERTRDQNKARELHPADLGSIDLESFVLMSRDGQRAVWVAAPDADRRGLALQIIRSRNIGPDEATIALYLECCEAKFGSDQAIPPAADIAALASERATDATRQGDDREAARYGRVVDNLAHGARLSWSNGELLIRSANRPATYATDGTRCNCPNSRSRWPNCWHLAAHELLIDLLDERAATADRAAERAEQVLSADNAIGVDAMCNGLRDRCIDFVVNGNAISTLGRNATALDDDTIAYWTSRGALVERQKDRGRWHMVITPAAERAEMDYTEPTDSTAMYVALAEQRRAAVEDDAARQQFASQLCAARSRRAA